ncbi:MAG TPA: hypothetical protein VFY26_03875, partial [Anaerolineales bacterium]|nr:hypothetical protein [Anaerolineales bacterium]
DNDVCRFTSVGRFGYFRHILSAKEAPIGEVMAAHLGQAARAHGLNGDAWKTRATHELITLLRDDYSTLMSVLGALSDVSV